MEKKRKTFHGSNTHFFCTVYPFIVVMVLIALDQCSIIDVLQPAFSGLNVLMLIVIPIVISIIWFHATK